MRLPPSMVFIIFRACSNSFSSAFTSAVVTPDPRAIRTVTGFFTALAEVRVVSGLTQRAVSERSGGRISAGTVSRLLNRGSLPATWSTAAAYLSACGVPDDQITQWQAVWQQLRTQTASAQEEGPAPSEGGAPERRRAWPGRLSVFRRGRGH